MQIFKDIFISVHRELVSNLFRLTSLFIITSDYQKVNDFLIFNDMKELILY